MSSPIRQEVHELLSSFGLSPLEEKIYLALLERGTSTLTPLSDMVAVPTTTVQSAIDRLVNRGVISVSKRGSRRVYAAEDPNIFRQQLEKQLEEVRTTLPLLRSLIKTHEGIADTKIFRGDQIRNIFHAAIACESKQIYEIVSAKEFQRTIGEKFHFTRRRVKNRVYLKSLRVESEEIKRYNKSIHAAELRAAKFLPTEVYFKASLMIFDETIALLSTKDEDLGLLIESRSCALMLREIFDILWSISRTMETL